jgi:TonB family protein
MPTPPPISKFLVMIIAVCLHAGVALALVGNPVNWETGVAKDFGSGGIEVSLAVVAEPPASLPRSAKPQEQQKIEDKDTAKILQDKPKQEVAEIQQEISEDKTEQRLPESTSRDGGGVPLTQKNYITTVQVLLEKNKRYPYQARRMQQEGTPVLYFEIDRSGKVLQFYIKESSGHPLLDQEVLAMIERAKPFPAMPDDMPVDKLLLTLPVQFYLR